ncbi:MAG TPA: tetratricopeptide repeat protein [Candidatus Dormibacteraeota bacterium]
MSSSCRHRLSGWRWRGRGSRRQRTDELHRRLLYAGRSAPFGASARSSRPDAALPLRQLFRTASRGATAHEGTPAMTDIERVRPRALAADEAIQLALESRWAEAVSVNRRLIEQHGPDEDACNRLGKALSELGEIDAALEAYGRTLEINPLNLIAPKMVRKLTALQEASATIEGSNAAIDVDLFTEEPGKSGLTQLHAPRGTAPGAVSPGDVVELETTGGTLQARTVRGIELDHLEAKVARRLFPLMQTGNRYEAAVARVDGDRIEIMIRETHQSPENARKTSFAIARGARREDFRPYGKESLLGAREPGDDDADGEDEEGSRAPGAEGEEIEGLRTVEGGLEEADGAGAFEEDEPEDEDARPEDSY